MLNKTRATILKGFKKNVQDLRALAAQERAREADALKQQLKFSAIAEGAKQESEACTRVADKIEELIS